MNQIARASWLFMASKNSAWFNISMWSLGEGVAVQASLNFIRGIFLIFPLCFPGVRFQNAWFIKDYAHKSGRAEIFKPFIIRYYDAVIFPDLPLMLAYSRFYTEFQPSFCVDKIRKEAQQLKSSLRFIANMLCHSNCMKVLPRPVSAKMAHLPFFKAHLTMSRWKGNRILFISSVSIPLDL